MRLAGDLPSQAPPGTDVGALARFVFDLASAVGFLLRRFMTAVNGQLTLGNGTDADNVKGIWVSYTSNAIANTEDLITHNLGLIPVGILVVNQDKSASWYAGTTAWNTTTLSLKWSAASVTARIFILAPPTTES